jgi:hypothetical protein
VQLVNTDKHSSTYLSYICDGRLVSYIVSVSFIISRLPLVHINYTCSRSPRVHGSSSWLKWATLGLACAWLGPHTKRKSTVVVAAPTEPEKQSHLESPNINSFHKPGTSTVLRAKRLLSNWAASAYLVIFFSIIAYRPVARDQFQPARLLSAAVPLGANPYLATTIATSRPSPQALSRFRYVTCYVRLRMLAFLFEGLHFCYLQPSRLWPVF